MSKRIQTEKIGAELVEASQNPDENSLPLSTRLFPYIYVAARRMSLRTISTWLEQKHGVSLSAAAISRALAKEELHLERLADSIAAPARYVGAAYRCDPMNLLYGQPMENGPSQLQMLIEENEHPWNEDDE